MSIRPVDFNGMIQSTSELSHTKAQEDARSSVQQASVTIEIDKKNEHQSHQVNETKEKDKEYRYDREGNGRGGSSGQRQSKKKDEKKTDGSVLPKHRSSFDIRV